MNIFIVSQLGQLVHYQTFIKINNLKNNMLVILFTAANMEVPQKIREQSNSDFFDLVVLHELPLYPGVPSLDKVKKITNDYRKLLNEKNVQELYVSSFEGHYAVLIKLAQLQSIKVHLVEEGLATYKFAKKGFKERVVNSSTKDFQLSINSVFGTTYLGRFLNVFAALIKKYLVSPIGILLKVILEIICLPLSILKVFSDFNKKESQQIKRIKRLKGAEKEYVSHAKEFNSINVAYPEVIKNVFTSDEINTFCTYNHADEYDEIARDIIAKYDMKSEDSLYLNQHYAFPVNEFSEVIVHKLLSKLDKGKLYIKFHPRDRKVTKIAFFDFITKNKLTNKIIIIKDSDFPVESIIKILKPKAIFGISTTALVYAQALSTDTKCYSLVSCLETQFKKNKKLEKVILVVKNHSNLLTLFQHIKFI